MKKRAVDLFDQSLMASNSKGTIPLAYLALTFLELDDTSSAKSLLRESMTNPVFEGEKDELTVVLWAILMTLDGKFREAEKLLKYSIKNFIGFSVVSQLSKSYIEYLNYMQDLKEKHKNPIMLID